jgi:hypothetical protein
MREMLKKGETVRVCERERERVNVQEYVREIVAKRRC